MDTKVFIASPLFNEPQIAIIREIEEALNRAQIPFYSARLHSKSDQIPPEERKNPRAWDAVFDSNVQGLNTSTHMIAVLEYAYPPETSLNVISSISGAEVVRTPISLPDAGTVWEMGYFHALRRPVYGYHRDQAGHLNLMLTHGCSGMVVGTDQLNRLVEMIKNRNVDPEAFALWNKVIE